LTVRLAGDLVQGYSTVRGLMNSRAPISTLKARTGQTRDLSLLGGEVPARLDAAPAHAGTLARALVMP
jgi:hypothetical protein